MGDMYAMSDSKVKDYSDVTIEILYLVHGHMMGFNIPHDDNPDLTRNSDKWYFADDCFYANGTWKQFDKWKNDRIQYEESMFPVDDGGFINVREISAMWQKINGIEHGRPAWLDNKSD